MRSSASSIQALVEFVGIEREPVSRRGLRAVCEGIRD